MLPYPSPQKRIPRPVAIATNYDEQANTVTLQIIWDTPRVPLYRYNGGYFISEEPIENVAALTEQQWAAMATPLPDSNAQGETNTEEVTIPDVVIGSYAYARVRVGRGNNWGVYGYMNVTVEHMGTGPGQCRVHGADIYIQDSQPSTLADYVWIDTMAVNFIQE